MNENTKEQETASRPDEANAEEQVKAVVRRLPISLDAPDRKFNIEKINLPKSEIVYDSCFNKHKPIGIANDFKVNGDKIEATLLITDKRIIENIEKYDTRFTVSGHIKNITNDNVITEFDLDAIIVQYKPKGTEWLVE